MKLFRHMTDQRGFVLPLSIMMALVLTVSGMGFLQLHYMEQRLAMGTRWNENAFFLANSGIERAREVFKINNATKWTSILDGSTTGFPTDANPDPLLCPDTSEGCVIPSFQSPTGNPMTSQTALHFPFSSTSEIGSYSVRAFNNGGAGDVGTTDGDGLMTLRAMGNVGGEKKIIQANIKAVSNMNVMNCQGTVYEPGGCYSEQGNPSDPVNGPGREPAAFPALPTLDLSSPNNNYYGTPSTSFPGLTQVTVASGTLTPAPGNYYFRSGDLTVNSSSAGTGMIVIYATGQVTVNSGVVINNAILIGATRVVLNGGTITSPSASASPVSSLDYPAIVAGPGTSGQPGISASKTSGSVPVIYGNIFSTGEVSLDRTIMHGSVIGNTIFVHGGEGNTTTDDYPSTTNYYDPMPGFTYPPALLTTTVELGSWKEIQ